LALIADVSIRPATVADVEAIVALINGYAARGEMLPKSLNQVYQNVRDFLVVERAREVVGCSALHVLWNNLGEIRSLAVREELRRQGIGGRIVRVLLGEARQLGLSQVFALTYKPEFFIGQGFLVVDRESLPRKIWVDCIDCVNFPQCDEVAVIRSLEVEA
jgi:amino-acid N-acetyltransferase